MLRRKHAPAAAVAKQIQNNVVKVFSWYCMIPILVLFSWDSTSAMQHNELVSVDNNEPSRLNLAFGYLSQNIIVTSATPVGQCGADKVLNGWFRIQTRPEILRAWIFDSYCNIALFYVLNDALQMMTSFENGCCLPSTPNLSSPTLSLSLVCHPAQLYDLLALALICRMRMNPWISSCRRSHKRCS